MSVYKHKRTGRWVAQISENGKSRQVGTFATKREADAAVRAEEQKGPRSGMTVTQWRDRWLARDDWKGGTRVHNTERTKAFAETHGAKTLRSINRTVARDWIAAHKSSHGALSAMFGAAMYEDDEHGNQLLPSNPFSKLVKKARPKRVLPSEWLTNDDILALEDVARSGHPWVGETMANAIRFAAETCIRPGELFVLTDADLDYEAGMLHIRRAAESKTRMVDTPKTPGSVRDIVLSAAAADAARRTKRLQGQKTIFATRTGKQFWLSSFHKEWDPIRNAAGRPGMDFYELRHYGATRLLEAGVSSEDVAVQMGHTDGGELVRKVYGHPSERKALDRVREALDGEAA